MSQYTSYYLYQKYEKRGEQDWIPVYPNSYSISGDSANPMPLSIKDENDPACGYVPVIEPIYEWRNMDIATNYYCMSCDADHYKLNIVTDTSGYTVNCDSATTITSNDIPNSAVYVSVGDCITSIGNSAFYGRSGLTGVSIASTVTTIGNSAFTNSVSLFDCSLPQSVTRINNSAFSGCTSLMNVILPNNLTYLGEHAFQDCLSMTDINIPNSLSAITESAFQDCDALHTVYIPSGITSIGKNAFLGCSGLYSVTVNRTTPPTLGEGAFTTENDNLVIYVPAASVNAYKNATNWSTYASKIQPIT